MKTKTRALMVMGLLSVTVLISSAYTKNGSQATAAARPASLPAAADLSEEEALKLGTDAYIYG